MEAYHVPGTLKILRGKTGMKQTKISCFSGTCVLVESDRHVNVASLVAQRVKKSAYNEGNLGSIPRLGRSPGERNGYSLQYSCLENSMDRGAWRATVHGDVKELDTTEGLTLTDGDKGYEKL